MKKYNHFLWKKCISDPDKHLQSVTIFVIAFLEKG